LWLEWFDWANVSEDDAMDEAVPVPVQIILFPGTTQERDDLFAPVARNCACRSGSAGRPTRARRMNCWHWSQCSNALVFSRRFSRSLKRAEWLQEPGWMSGDL